MPGVHSTAHDEVPAAFFHVVPPSTETSTPPTVPPPLSTAVPVIVMRLPLSTEPLDAGTRGALRLSLSGRPFAADVVVQRVTSDAGSAGGYCIGAKFLSISAEHLQVIERFIAE